MQEEWVYTAEINWKGNEVFEGQTAKGAPVVMDSSHDGQAGASPMEMILFALAGCTAMDVLSILKKMKVPIHRLTIAVSASRNKEFPKVFRKFHLLYRLWTDDAAHRPAFERAVRLSREKYCSVGLMLEKAAPITYELEVFVDGKTESVSHATAS